MYDRLGDKVSRHPWVVVIGWSLILGVLLWKAPRKEQVSLDGVFSFLPPTSPSIVADQVYRQAFFPKGESKEAKEAQQDQEDPAGSSVVIVIRRTDLPDGLTDADKTFVEKVLEPRLEQLQETTPAGRSFDPAAQYPEVPQDQQRIKKISSRTDARIAPLLDSEDGKATLIRLTLRGEFLNYDNMLAIARIEHVLESEDVKRQMPAGLEINISGSATVGRDMLLAEANSARSTDHWTKVLVIALLLLIYRAPIVALIPLITVGVAVTVALRMLTFAASQGWIGFFCGNECLRHCRRLRRGGGLLPVPHCQIPGTARPRRGVHRIDPEIDRIRGSRSHGQRRHEHLWHLHDDLRGVREVPAGGAGDFIRHVHRAALFADSYARTAADSGPLGILARCPERACRAGSRLDSLARAH